MIDFEKALAYLIQKDVTAQKLSNLSGISKGSLHAVFSGVTKNPRKNTRDAVIAYAKILMKDNDEVIEEGVVLSADENILDKRDKNYIKKLTLAVRANEKELLKEQSFKDLIYIQALKMALLAKQGESISIEKLMELNT